MWYSEPETCTLLHLIDSWNYNSSTSKRKKAETSPSSLIIRDTQPPENTNPHTCIDINTVYFVGQASEAMTYVCTYIGWQTQLEHLGACPYPLIQRKSRCIVIDLGAILRLSILNKDVKPSEVLYDSALHMHGACNVPHEKKHMSTSSSDCAMKLHS